MTVAVSKKGGVDGLNANGDNGGILPNAYGHLLDHREFSFPYHMQYRMQQRDKAPAPCHYEGFLDTI